MAACVFGSSDRGSTSFLASHWVDTTPDLLPRGQWHQLSPGAAGRLSIFCVCEFPALGHSHSMEVTYLQVRVGIVPDGSTQAAGSELPLRHSFPTASSRTGSCAHLSVLVSQSCWLGKLSSLPWWDPQLQSAFVCSGCLNIFTEEDLCLCNNYSNHDICSTFWG